MRKTKPKCPRCKIAMKLGKALDNRHSVGFPDFVGDKGNERGCTMSLDATRITMIDCWKCPKCGHSQTI